MEYTDIEQWVECIDIIDPQEKVLGGIDGPTNRPIKQLANRTAWLRNNAIPASEKGVINGVASLDGNGRVVLAQLPDSVLGNVQYQGLWDTATNAPNLDAVKPKGHYYICSSAAVRYDHDFNVGDWIISNGITWDKVDNTDAVAAVAGLTGNITAANLKAALSVADSSHNHDSTYLKLTGGTVSGSITASGFYQSSSRSLKENIQPFTESALDIVNGLGVVTFNYKNSHNDHTHVGIIAEDTPALISGKNRDGFDIATTVGILLKAVQELSDRVKKLEEA